eukprot:jgi/Botrbrau1/12072/Bobra.0186s0001.1
MYRSVWEGGALEGTGGAWRVSGRPAVRKAAVLLAVPLLSAAGGAGEPPNGGGPSARPHPALPAVTGLSALRAPPGCLREHPKRARGSHLWLPEEPIWVAEEAPGSSIREPLWVLRESLSLPRDLNTGASRSA